MKQLIYDKNFKKIIEEEKYWIDLQDIPENITNFIQNTIDKFIIYDIKEKTYHCSKCLSKLENNYCNTCNIKYYNNIQEKYKINIEINKIKKLYETSSYFIYDIIGESIYLYIINNIMTYNSTVFSLPHQQNKLEIDKVYEIKSNGIKELKTNKYYSYKEIDNKLFNYEEEFDIELYDIFEIPSIDKTFIYEDNIDKLKDTKLYKYTYIWDLKEKLINNNINTLTLTLFPLYYRQYEYLIKMKLYNLALKAPYIVKENKNFKEAFNIEKNYYQFMKNIDITPDMLESLQIYKTTNVELLNFMSENLYIIRELNKYVDISRLKEYFDSQKLESTNLHEYYDYIRCCNKMNLNIKDKKILFPKNLLEEHDRIIKEVIIIENEDIENKINKLSNLLKINTYDDSEYIIFPADSINSLIDESRQMSNCVRTYCTDYSENICHIYFMREKKHINKSLVTIEVKDNKVVQAKAKYNSIPSEECLNIIKKWEKQIIPITKTK